MAGYDLLGDVKDFEQDHSIEVLLAPSAGVTVESFNAGIQGFKYYKDGQTIVFTSPMQSTYLPQFLNAVAEGELFQNKHILVVLHGTGATEAHYVTAHIKPDRNIRIIDSKMGDPKRFFSENPGNKVWAAIKGLFLAMRSGSQILDTLIPGKQVQYIPLGTQSFFDGISCGFHAVSNLELCKQFITNSEEINRQELLRAQETPVQAISLRLFRYSDYKRLADSRFIIFIRHAWQETWMPLLSQNERSKRSFRHYFLGWPYQGTFQRALYILSLGFIFQPVINLLKIPFMFLPRALAESVHWVRDRAIDWAPRTYISQSLRSLFMLGTYPVEGFLKATSMLLGLIFDPKTSIQLSYRIHPALGILTGFVIAGIYITFAFVALPAIWNVLSPLAISLIKTPLVLLAEPIMLLYTGIPTVTAAACSLFLSVGSLLGIHWALENIASWVDLGNNDLQQTTLAPQFEDSFEEQGERSPYRDSGLQRKTRELDVVDEIHPPRTLDLRKRNRTDLTHLLEDERNLERQNI